MADAAATQVILDGPRHFVVRLSSVSDGTGEAAVEKIDPGDLSGDPVSLSLERISWTTVGMGVQLHWDADTPDLMWSIPPDDTNTIDFSRFGGLPNPKSTGWTGKVTLTTISASNSDAYNIVLHFKKKAGEAPLAILTEATTSVEENENLAYALTANRAATWTIEGGADADEFDIVDGVLIWAEDGTQDYETPADANTDNVYEVVVRATDAGGGTDDLTISVTVTDAEE